MIEKVGNNNKNNSKMCVLFTSLVFSRNRKKSELFSEIKAARPLDVTIESSLVDC